MGGGKGEEQKRTGFAMITREVRGANSKEGQLPIAERAKVKKKHKKRYIGRGRRDRR